jgi:glucokinase
MILAADIGGTNARLALFDRIDRAPRLTTVYATAEWPSAEAIVRRFADEHAARVTAACLAVAGPVVHGRAERVNLPWTVDARRVQSALELERVSVVNDLEANARGVELLGPDDLAVVNAGAPDELGTKVVVSAGTGLGEAALVRDGSRWIAVAGEGGHADFAPRSEIEVQLYCRLAARYPHVSYERVCSGQGLVNIYEFLNRGGERLSPAAIAEAAEVDSSGSAAHALRLFASIYGARAANVALSFMATGGVYLGGGIAPRNLRSLTDGVFMRAFTSKGRLSPLLETIPVYVVLNDRAALLGAAAIAADEPA